MKSLRNALIIVVALVGAGYFIATYVAKSDQREVNSTEFDSLVVALRENRNRLEVYRLSGTVITDRTTSGGWGGILIGRMKAKQPWSVSYFADMKDLTLDDYIWDKATRTLMVRPPSVAPDAPNIDESKQVVDTDGMIVTRDMQNRLRREIARGAQKQAADEATKPENIAKASQAARSALEQTLRTPLKAAGLRDVTVVVRGPDGTAGSAEEWDRSRSIAEVLADRMR